MTFDERPVPPANTASLRIVTHAPLEGVRDREKGREEERERGREAERQ